MTENKQFGFKSFEISKTDRFLDEVKLYEIDKNHSDDLDESNLFYVYSDSKENIIQLVDKLNELAEENERLHDEVFRLRTELAYDRTVNDGKDWFKAEDEHLKWKSGEND